MKISINKRVAEQILSQLQPFLEKKDTSQITSHIFLEAKDKILTLKATDYEVGLKIDADNINIEKEGKVTANGKKLLEIVRILKDEDIILETKDSNLVIKQRHSIFKLPSFDPEEFPIFPETNNKPNIKIDSIEFITSLKKIIPSIDTNNPKYELNGALIDIKEDFTNLVSTDTRRLAIVKLKNSSEKNLSLIIPKKAIIEIQKLFLEKLDIFYDETNLIIKSQNYLFFTKLINGNFQIMKELFQKR